MSIPVTCCNPTPVSQTVNIPGPEGENGNDGAAGLNAFSITTADFDVPNVGDNVTVLVGDSSWATVGQNVFIQGAGTFSVVSKPGAASMTLEYLNYAGNTHSGETISSGAGVSPAGTQPSVTLLPAVSQYALAGSQSLSNSDVQLLSSSVALATKSYLLMATFRLDFNAATFASNQVVGLKLRETTNGPADIANAVVNLKVPEVTAESGTFIEGAFPPVVYSAQNGDTIEMFGTIDNTPYSGALQVVELSIVAIPLF